MIRGYNLGRDGIWCSSHEKDNFENCPISAYLNILGKKPIKMADFFSKNDEKKFRYSATITRKELDESEMETKFMPTSIYFVSKINKQYYNSTDQYTIDILTCDLDFGLWSTRCDNCLGIYQIIRYSGLFKYAIVSHRYHMMDIDFEPFRLVVVKLNIVQLHTTVDNKDFQHGRIEPSDLLILKPRVNCYLFWEYSGLSINEFNNFICIDGNMKISNFVVHATFREVPYVKFVIVFIK
ncbi:hypothetical protein RF11_00270 [Thelohanellus kitauei]|uniref:Uncharacterized protein n=1 Tax=Thelohanellus kitauei TaxID=669202 RepID=A0A0C2MYE0_THEKT|nr:hypothetical protein RF11_00270 [Thelohanellus kitauei]